MRGSLPISCISHCLLNFNALFNPQAQTRISHFDLTPLSSVIDSTYVNTKISCWNECSKKMGLCSFCGEGGYCCKTGSTGCPANVMTQATASSQCIMPYVNTKVTCWDRCSKKTGLCSFCGAFGYCCKTGATGCEGNLMTLATASSECIAPKGLGGISNLFSITTS